MAAKKKGPAEVAASPSHGSNIPYQEKAVNRQQATTAPRAPARAPFDYRRAIEELAAPIDLASKRMKVVDQIAGELSFVELHNGMVILPAAEFDNLVFMIEETAKSVRVLDDAFSGAEHGPDSETDRRKTAVAEASDFGGLDYLIAAHRAAARELEEAMRADGEDRVNNPNNEDSERTVHADQEEVRAFDALLMWRPTTLAGSAERARYLFGDPASPWKDSMPGSKKLDLFIASMTEV